MNKVLTGCFATFTLHGKTVPTLKAEWEEAEPELSTIFWKNGDKVVFVGSKRKTVLEVGRVYTIKETNGNYVWFNIDGVERRYSIRNFRLHDPDACPEFMENLKCL